MVLGIVIGALIFDALPGLLDKQTSYDRSICGTALFMFMFWIFIRLRGFRRSNMSADNPDEYSEIIEENFAISYPEKFLCEKFPGLYP